MDDDAAPHAPAFHIQRILPFLVKFWWLPFVTMVLCLGGAAVYVWFKPPTYVSKGRMWETVKLRLPEGSMFSEDSQNFLGTQTELLQSETLRDLALARLRSISNSPAIPLDSDGLPLPVIINVKGNSKSSVFLVEATSSRAAFTQAYLEALMNVYLEYKKNIRKVVSGDTLASISEQVQRSERDLKAEQDILSAFQRTNNLAILEEEGRTSGGYLARLRTQLSDLELEARLLSAAASNPPAALLTETDDSPAATGSKDTSVGASPEHQTAYKELELLKMQRQKLSRYLQPKHPKIVKLDADIERASKLIDIYQRQNQDQLAASRATIQMKIANVQLSIKEWEAKVILANSRMAEGDRLKLNVARNQSVFERLSMLVQNVGISRNIDQETLAILEPAGVPKRSYAQELSLLAVSTVSGVGLGLGIILLLVLRDDRFTSFSEIDEKLGEVVVCQVPEVTGLKLAEQLPLLEVNDERHAYAESFRSLRSALLYMTIESERPKVILVTSAVPHEGKSTVSANLARALAMGGSRVVLVDADLRKGVLHERLELQQSPGLAEVLTGADPLDKVIQTNSMPNLSFIASGRVIGHSGDIMLGAKFDQLLARLREQYDYVVIDTSPVFAADDATTLAPKVDGTLFVVRSRYSKAGPVREALGLLYQRNARVLGVIFNQTDSAARSNYYYKYAEYYTPTKPV
ncbi:MAG: polysaccharide biosynthesis tyrosine autokinase [Acidobacteriia bacterium]|nr:polysaccharide biosynthesis tyrosine autokinase [Terriglobia bacterium]